MYDFKQGDTVTFLFDRKECHGIIQKIGEKNASVWIEEMYEARKIPIERLTYVAPVLLNTEQIQKLCRYEVKWSELIAGHPDYVDVCLEKPYTMTFEDMLAAARNIMSSGDDNETVREEWYCPLYDLMFESGENILFEDTPSDVEMLEYLPDRHQVFREMFYTILDEITDSDADPVSESIAEVITHIEHFMADEKRPVLERDYSDAEKEHYIRMLGNDDRLKKATELELTVYRIFVEDLLSKNNHTALRCKGYGCYGGDPAFECDWNVALECVTRLYELTGNPVYANTLGYIYYYGRCWDGEAKYDEAFKYFSVGAAGFYYESRYKLADMFVHGYGVPKNTEIAYTIVSELYDQNVQYILDGNFNCKFADVALRLGSYTEKGYGRYFDIQQAYKYYLQADFAIRQRLQYDYYGDLSVADSIRKRLNNLLESGKINKPKRSAYVDLPELLRLYLKKYRKLQLKLTTMKSGDVKLTIRIAPFKDEKYHPKLFITEEETGFCGMLETLVVRAKGGQIIKPKTVDTSVDFDNINSYYEPDTETDGVTFMLGDKVQAIVTGETLFTSPLKASGRKFKVASVFFSPGGRHYDYLLDIDGVEVGDTVCVMTDQGKTEVIVSAILEKTESELALPINKYKKIIEKV